jgi:resuscitation-promoting factor RpfB
MSGKRSARPTRFIVRHSRQLGAIGVVTALVAGAVSIEAVGTASAATLDTVRLTVDGVASTVTTSASSVGALLTEQSVTVDATDLVSPGPNALVSDGMSVAVDHAALITVVDGDLTTEHLVTADTVAATSEELALPQPTFSALSTTSFEPTSYRRTVVFGPAGARLTQKDRIRDGARAVVQNVRVAYPVKKSTVKARVSSKNTPLLPAGTTRVVNDGRDGVRRIVVRRLFVDGELSQRRVVDRVWLKAPHRKVVRTGTGPNWRGLANCESGGNPNAVNPAGFYGLYQFSLATWRGLGGQGLPTDHGYWEQTYRAWKLYQSSGRSPWPVCGAYL